MSEISFINWPELNNEELIKYYNEIKNNQHLNINWNSPGRIDPSLYEKITMKEQDQDLNNKQQVDKIDSEILNKLEEESIINDENDKFDLFDEFNSEMEKNSNQVLKLTHSKTPRDADKKVASMDKILHDIRKKYEFENKFQTNSNTGSAEFMLLVNNDFMEEDLTDTQNIPNKNEPNKDNNKQNDLINNN